MKIIDRYVIISFLKNYVLSFVVLVGMYVVLDMVFNFDELKEAIDKLTEHQDKAHGGGLKAALVFGRYVLDFYAFQIPLYFMHLSGMITVVAASFTLMRMIRFNELSALLSAGVPLLRVAAPIILVALVLQGLLWADQELLIPNIIHKLERRHDHAMAHDSKSRIIEAMRAEDNSKLFASAYFANANPPRMQVVDVVYQDEEYRPVAHIRADAAVWDAANQRWNLTNGRIDRNIAPGSAKRLSSEPVEHYKSSITPMEIQLFYSGNFVELLSTRRINDLLQRPRSYGRADLLRVKHARVAAVGVNIILLLLAISSVLTREPRQLKSAASRCVILCGACLSAVFLGNELAGQAPIGVPADLWPALMAFLPVFTFGPLSVWLLDRVKT